jgi:hypothetical protein
LTIIATAITIARRYVEFISFVIFISPSPFFKAMEEFPHSIYECVGPPSYTPLIFRRLSSAIVKTLSSCGSKEAVVEGEESGSQISTKTWRKMPENHHKLCGM